MSYLHGASNFSDLNHVVGYDNTVSQQHQVNSNVLYIISPRNHGVQVVRPFSYNFDDRLTNQIRETVMSTSNASMPLIKQVVSNRCYRDWEKIGRAHV